MAFWRRVWCFMASLDEKIDMVKYRLRERLGNRQPVIIVAYRTYGLPERFYIKGRVLEDRDITPAAEGDTKWHNLINMYKRFKSNEIPYAKVQASFQGQTWEVVANEEGFFEAWLPLNAPLEQGILWHEVKLELLSPLRPGQQPAQDTACIFVPPPNTQFGVISDIDDTVIHTDVTHLLHMLRTVLLGNARTRMPLHGVAAFYRALLGGKKGDTTNPLFYVSSSPWNLYDLLSEFFQINQIPLGPMLFLRDWGISKEDIFGPRQKHRPYKLATIRHIMDAFPILPFILIGDSAEEDPEIYSEIVHSYPGRVLAVYIRNVLREPQRLLSLQKLAGVIEAAGSELVLADDTLALAQHAAGHGYIPQGALPIIQAARLYS